MFWLAIAAALVAPEPTGTWLSDEDMPVLKADARVQIRVTLTPDGKILSCEIEGSSGHRDVDVYVCQLAQQRLQISPAKREDGKSAYGVYRIGINFRVDRYAPRMKPEGDLVLTVKQLPKHLSSPTVVSLVFAVDATGRIIGCGANRKKQNQLLVKTGCQELVKGYVATPARSEAEQSVASVQTGQVVFYQQ